MHQSKQVSPKAPAKKKTRLNVGTCKPHHFTGSSNVPGPEDLPDIWQTLAFLTKEKARPAFKIACRENARALQCKSPQVTHAVAVLLLGINFFTKDPECVNNTVNIFQFPDHFLSVGSEASMVTQIWDTALDVNTLTSYADAAALMEQKRIPPIVSWEAAENMLDQWLVVATVLLGPQERPMEVFKLATLLEAADEVNSCLQAQVAVQQDMRAPLVQLVQTEFNRASAKSLPARSRCVGPTSPPSFEHYP